MIFEGQDYIDQADELVRRILKLIPNNPEIMNFTNPWDLFKIERFKCDDIGPTLFQATWALGRAKRLYREGGV